MNMSVKFNGIELGSYIDVLQGFNPFAGANWDPFISEGGQICRGTNFNYTTYKSKTIQMPFTILDNIEEKYDEIQRILNVDEPKPLIFGNTPNKIFYAIPTGNLDFDAIECFGEGTITWLIPDGLSHSAKEDIFYASIKNGVMETTIVNNGTESVPIDYTITHKHENGYIGIVSEHGVIQFGYKDEVDKEQKKKSEQLINYRTASAFDAMTNGQGVLGFDYAKNGTFRTHTENGKSWLALGNIGSGSSWHGASKMVNIPADSNGVSVAQEFYVQGKVWFETGTCNETGMIEMTVGDENGNHLAGIRIAKYQYGSNTAYAMLDIMGVEQQRIPFEPSYRGVTSREHGEIYIVKRGDYIGMYFGGTEYPFRRPEVRDRKAKTLSVFLGQHGLIPSSNVLTRMYFEYMFYRKDNVSYWVDIPNRYSAESVVFIDGSATKPYVDGIVRLEDEIRGSKYFHAPPGETKVQFYYSAFSSPPPSIVAKIREAYL